MTEHLPAGRSTAARRSMMLGGAAWIVLLMFLVPAQLFAAAEGQPSTAEWFTGIGMFCLALPLALLLAVIGFVLGVRALGGAGGSVRSALPGVLLNGLLLAGFAVYLARMIFLSFNPDLSITTTFP